MKAGRLDLSHHRTREPVAVALLTGLTILLILAVTGLSRAYHMEQESLAARWSIRGQASLDARRYADAVTDFRTSLLYSRDSYSYQLSLAQALIGEHRINEAYSYLINLWDREPENGLVNLELARIAAGRGETQQALRYYHNAIYATWPGNQDVARRNTRLELIHFLLHINARPQAESELIALAANLGDDPAEQVNVGGLFLQAQDDERALAAYRLSLRSDRHNQAAMAGAGEAAFRLGLYPAAQRYLQEAVNADPGDAASAGLLKTTRFVLQMDPFRQPISARRRNQIAIETFAAAGDRIMACLVPGGAVSPPPSWVDLAQQWTKLKPQITARRLWRNPDMVNTAMDLVFNIERQTNGVCGGQTETDKALLLIAQLHEEI